MQHISCSRHVLVSKCSELLEQKEQHQFQSFAEILNAYIHFKTQKNLELMKQAYAYFSPNQDTEVYPKLNQSEKDQQASILADTFRNILLNANYKELTDQDIKEALNQSSLVEVNTDVELEDYERILCFYRGNSEKQVTIKLKYFREKEIQFESYDNVALLLQIKPQSYFDEKGTDDEELNFKPGKTYLYLYKDIPHFDLELLFPNVKISMNFKDKLMLLVPAVGAAIPMLIKVLPAITVLVGALAFVIFGLDLGGEFNVDINNPKAVYPVLITVLSACVALGGFAARQYIKYKNKRLQFLKKVSDVLFFKSLDISQGVLNAIVDSAEEEESKEMLLIYYLLNQENKPLSKEEIRIKLNAWLLDNLSMDLDINVDSALEKLQSLTATAEDDDTAIVQKNSDGKFQASTVETAKRIVDDVWDNLFHYANSPAN